MRHSLKVPSGITITLAGLFRQLASLDADDIGFIFKARRAKVFRQLVGELLGKAFAGRYNSRRTIVTGNSINFWCVHNGSFREKFIQVAVNTRMHDLDPDLLILRAEELSRSKGMGAYPTPHLVCGPYVFGEVLNGWTPGHDDPPPPDQHDELPETDDNEGWIWQPGLQWNAQIGKFIKK